jgi:DNA-binding beta-propeller fold protein YncE
MKYLNLIVIVAILSIVSCKKSDPPAQQEFQLEDGVFIVNQGTFTVVNATLAYFETGKNNLIKELFYQANAAPLGDVAQSITMDNKLAWIVVNNSGLIHGINRSDAKIAGTITGLPSPRYMLKINDTKAYVSNFFSNTISIVNPETYQLTGQIDAEGRTTEEMVLVGKTAFVANWSGFNQDKKNNVILVVDTETDQLTGSIEVGIEPNSLVVDKNENIWVLCTGGFELQTKDTATLWKIDPVAKIVSDTLKFADMMMYPSGLEIGPGKDTLYLLNNGVIKMGIDEESIPTEVFIEESNEKNFGYLAVDHVTGEIYASDPLDYVSGGYVYRYSSQGKLMTTLPDVGIVPGSFGINR